MNIDTGEVKPMAVLTDAEKKSGRWKPVPAGTQLNSPKRRERTRLMLLHGITTGRQWVRLRRRLRAEGAKV